MPDVLSWLQSFSLYAAVICSRYPNKNRELFAYQNFIVGEARRGGRGWLMYDMAFRQQMTSIEGTNFAVLNQSLYSTTCLAYGGRVKACPSCTLLDHGQDECALKQLDPNAMGRVEEIRKSNEYPSRKRYRRGACLNWNGPKGCSNAVCKWEHKCLKCGGDHKKMVCTASEYSGKRL